MDTRDYIYPVNIYWMGIVKEEFNALKNIKLVTFLKKAMKARIAAVHRVINNIRDIPWSIADTLIFSLHALYYTCRPLTPSERLKWNESAAWQMEKFIKRILDGIISLLAIISPEIMAPAGYVLTLWDKRIVRKCHIIWSPGCPYGEAYPRKQSEEVNIDLYMSKYSPHIQKESDWVDYALKVVGIRQSKQYKWYDFRGGRTAAMHSTISHSVEAISSLLKTLVYSSVTIASIFKGREIFCSRAKATGLEAEASLNHLISASISVLAIALAEPLSPIGLYLNKWRDSIKRRRHRE